MPGRRRIPDDSIPKLQTVMANTGSKLEYQRALSVWLSAGAGLTDQQIAAALRWTVRTVRAVRGKFRMRGEGSFRDHRLHLPDDDVARLPERMKQARSAKEFQRLQCLWLGAALGLDSGQVGIAVGLSRGHVRSVQSRYRRSGGGQPRDGRRGEEPLRNSKPRPAPEEAEKLRTALSQARSPAAYRRVLCLWMRVGLEMSIDLITSVLRCSRRDLLNLERAYRRDGAAILKEAGRGGRRHELLTSKHEYALLRRLRQQAWPSSTMSFQAIHQEVEKEAGRRVKASTVQQILDRHGWGRIATVLIPQHSVSSGLSDATLAKQKPGRDSLWYLHSEDPESWFEAVREAKEDGPKPT